jgi:hypothetical protein
MHNTCLIFLKQAGENDFRQILFNEPQTRKFNFTNAFRSNYNILPFFKPVCYLSDDG